MNFLNDVNYVYKMELLAILGIFLLVMYILYRLKLIGGKKR